MTDQFPLSEPGSELNVDGDKVQFDVSNGSPGKIVFCLSSDINITWWKGIKVFGNESWDTIGLIETQDSSRGPVCITLDIGQFQAGRSRIEFWKAKAFGAHANIKFYSFDPFQYVGKQLSFTWKTD